MDTIPPEQRKAQQAASKDDLVQYVEELASPEEYPDGDAWISLTDAARITRTSEAMARRWVTSGRLKVKKEPAGIPARTRLVRLSDVANIRPIVDPTAAITGDVRKLDLPSIPRQQLLIMADHRRLTEQVQAALEASQRHASETRTALEELAARLQQQQEDLLRRLSTQREEWQAALEQERQRSEALAEQIGIQANQIEEVNNQLSEQRSRHQRELEQLRTHLLGQLEEARVALERKLSEQAQEYHSQVDQLHLDLTQQLERVAQDVASQNERLGTIEQRVEQAATQAQAMQATTLGYQKRADKQESRLEELWKLLQGEIAARQALEQQVQQNLPPRKRTT